MRHFPSKKSLFAAAILLLMIGCGFGQNPKPEKLATKIWYWNSRINFRPEELDALRRMGIDEIYIRAGQFDIKRGEIEIIRSIEQWRPIEGFKIALVFNFTPQMIGAFPSLDVKAASRSISGAIQEAVKKIEESGVKVAGIQLDFDVPTSSLNRYEEMMGSIRASIGEMELSITALADWNGRPEFSRLLKRVDYYIPQLYGMRIPRKITELNTISDPTFIRSQLKILEDSPIPYYVGLPAYGYCLVFDKEGKLQSLRTDINKRAAIKNPDLRLTDSIQVREKSKASPANYTGENLYYFEAVSDTFIKGVPIREGWRIVFDVTTSEALMKNLEIVRTEGRGKLLGVAIFRFPQPDEEEVLSLKEIESAFAGRRLEPELTLDHRVIERRGDSYEIEISALNAEEAESFLSPASIQMEIDLIGLRLAEVDKGDFDEAETRLIDGDDSIAATARTANRIALSSAHIGRKERMRFRIVVLRAAPDSKLEMRSSARPAFALEKPDKKYSKIFLLPQRARRTE